MNVRSVMPKLSVQLPVKVVLVSVQDPPPYTQFELVYIVGSKRRRKVIVYGIIFAYFFAILQYQHLVGTRYYIDFLIRLPVHEHLGNH